MFKLIRDDISPSIRRYASEMRKSLGETVKLTAKGITRRVIDLTPPGSEGVKGAAAYRHGKNRIRSQMESVLAPTKIKGRRKIVTVFGHRLKRPVYVATTEKFPDVAGLYRSKVRFSNTGVGARVSGRGKCYVDTRKFEAELKRRQARVGLLASGWAAAAAALDVPVQNWISRHGSSSGRVSIDMLGGGKMRVRVENLAPGAPPSLVSAMVRQIASAVEYQRNAMLRAIQGYHDRIKRDIHNR